MTTLPQSRPITRADLESIPDDGHRYELIDGAIVVTPAPNWLHQRAVLWLAVLLHRACPPPFAVLFAPFDVALGDDTVMQPDIVVARRVDYPDRDLPTAPLLAVEVLSPSTRLINLTLKKARYEIAGCPSYWVFDPQDLVLTAWELREGRYVEAARVAGGERFVATSPYAVELCPAELVR